ncbi:MAG: rhodanese-like domain-containing protein [Gammaproteobacteria bacterium]|nr:rhodanese-like domain-containing protein [Gammaproteobacteria bacterium]
MQVFREIEVADLVDLLERDNSIKLIDIRSVKEINTGFIPGAEHMPMHMLPIKMNELEKDRKTILYCHIGARSAKACAYLMENGFEQVHNLRGGMIAWAKSGLQMAQ